MCSAFRKFPPRCRRSTVAEVAAVAAVAVVAAAATSARCLPPLTAG